MAIFFCCKPQWRPCNHLTGPSARQPLQQAASNTVVHSLSCLARLDDCSRHSRQQPQKAGHGCRRPDGWFGLHLQGDTLLFLLSYTFLLAVYRADGGSEQMASWILPACLACPPPVNQSSHHGSLTG